MVSSSCHAKLSPPAYIRAFEEGLLPRRVEQALEALRSCRVFPRDCQIDTFSDKIGVCKSGRYARITSAFPHFGEEDCLRGWNGSGTIFFGWWAQSDAACFARISKQASLAKEPKSQRRSLRESWWISSRRAVTTSNFVTPEHVVPQILEALPIAIERGLRLPLVYNTSAYDSLESIQPWTGSLTFTCPTSNFGTQSIVEKLSGRKRLCRRRPRSHRRDARAGWRAKGG